MKKLAIAFAIIFLVSALAGCQTSSGTSASATPSTAPTSSAAPQQSENPAYVPTLPIVSTTTDFSIWTTSLTLSVTAGVGDLNDCHAWQEMEKRTNIHINWTIPSGSMDQEAFNLVMASQEYPDAFMCGTSFFQGGLDNAIDQQQIMDLRDLVDNYAPDYKAAMNMHGEKFLKDFYTDSGYMPAIRQIYHLIPKNILGYFARQDWLDEVGYTKTPETFTDWEEMLTLLKDNNKGSVAPLYPVLFNINQNILTDGFDASAGMLNKEGTVVFSPIEQNYKDYLALMSGWYQKGLIDKDFSTRIAFYPDFGLFMNESFAVYPHVYTFYDVFTNAGKGSNPNYKLTALPYPKTSNDQAIHVVQMGVGNPVADSAATISATCKDPITLTKWLNQLYSEDGAILLNYGIEGEGYNIVDGKIEVADLITKNPDGLSQNDATIRYAAGPTVPYLYYQERELTKYISKEAVDARDIWTKNYDVENQYNMPKISLTVDESTRYTALINDINTYVAEYVSKTINGTEDLNSSWDKYVSQIKSMGIDECISIYQGALDRYNNR